MDWALWINVLVIGNLIVLTHGQLLQQPPNQFPQQAQGQNLQQPQGQFPQQPQAQFAQQPQGQFPQQPQIQFAQQPQGQFPQQSQGQIPQQPQSQFPQQRSFAPPPQVGPQGLPPQFVPQPNATQAPPIPQRQPHLSPQQLQLPPTGPGLSRFQTWFIASKILLSVPKTSDYVLMIQPEFVKGIPSTNISQALQQATPAFPNPVLKTFIEQSNGMLISQQSIIFQKIRTKLAEPFVIRSIMSSQEPGTMISLYNPRLIESNIGEIIKIIKEISRDRTGTVKTKLLPYNFLSTWISWVRKTGNVPQWTGDDIFGKSFFGSSYQLNLAILGLSCGDLEILKIQDILPVLVSYRQELYTLRKEGPIGFPLDLRNCALERVVEFLKLRNGTTAGGDVNILSELKLPEIGAIGGEILTAIPTSALENLPLELKLEIIQEIGRTELSDLFRLTSVDQLQWYSDNLVKDFIAAAQMGVIPQFGNLLCYGIHNSTNLKNILETSGPTTKTCCLNPQNQQKWATMLKETFGTNTSNWRSIDLVAIGDLLTAISEEEINQLSLEEIARSLVPFLRTSGLNLPIRKAGELQPVSFIKACAASIGDGEEYMKSYKALMRRFVEAAQLMVDSVKTMDQVFEEGLQSRTRRAAPLYRAYRIPQRVRRETFSLTVGKMAPVMSSSPPASASPTPPMPIRVMTSQQQPGQPLPPAIVQQQILSPSPAPSPPTFQQQQFMAQPSGARLPPVTTQMLRQQPSPFAPNPSNPTIQQSLSGLPQGPSSTQLISTAPQQQPVPTARFTGRAISSDPPKTQTLNIGSQTGAVQQSFQNTRPISQPGIPQQAFQQTIPSQQTFQNPTPPSQTFQTPPSSSQGIPQPAFQLQNPTQQQMFQGQAPPQQGIPQQSFQSQTPSSQPGIPQPVQVLNQPMTQQTFQRPSQGFPQQFNQNPNIGVRPQFQQQIPAQSSNQFSQPPVGAQHGIPTPLLPHEFQAFHQPPQFQQPSQFQQPPQFQQPNMQQVGQQFNVPSDFQNQGQPMQVIHPPIIPESQNATSEKEVPKTFEGRAVNVTDERLGNETAHEEGTRSLSGVESMPLKLTCLGIKNSGPAVIGLSVSDFNSLPPQELFDCIEAIGLIEWDEPMKNELLQLYREKLNLTETLNTVNLLELGSLISALEFGSGSGASSVPQIQGPSSGMLGMEMGTRSVEHLSGQGIFDIDQLDLKLPESLDTLGILGSVVKDSATLKLIAHHFVLLNNITPQITNPHPDELRIFISSLGNILCRIDISIIRSLFDGDRSLFLDTSPILGHLEGCDHEWLELMANHAMDPSSYGNPETWTKEDLNGIGVVAAGLPITSLAKIPPSAMPGLSPLAVRAFTTASLQSFSASQLSNFSYEAAASIQPKQVEVLGPEQISALNKVLTVESSNFNIPPVSSVILDLGKTGTIAEGEQDIETRAIQNETELKATGRSAGHDDDDEADVETVLHEESDYPKENVTSKKGNLTEGLKDEETRSANTTEKTTTPEIIEQAKETSASSELVFKNSITFMSFGISLFVYHYVA